MARKKSSADGAKRGAPAPGGKKGRPTPSRKEAEAARRRPLVATDRKEAKRREREARDIAWARQEEALRTGDERYLPERDRGKARRFTRDWVDARRSLSEYLLPVMLAFIVLSIGIGFISPSANQSGGAASVVLAWTTIALYIMFAIAIIEVSVVWPRIKKRIRIRYPDEKIPKRTYFYAFSRMIMLRRFRSPKPQVGRGEFPFVPES